MFTVLFAVARTVGWISQWKEMIEDPNQKIGRPRQLYTGPARATSFPSPSADRECWPQVNFPISSAQAVWGRLRAAAAGDEPAPAPRG